MCDTLGRVDIPVPLFAKNSDRSPNEPQVLEYHPAASHGEEPLYATYMKIEQARQTHAMVISRPAWMWGAEMGVNDCGVCIGNEAVFTKGRYGRQGLTGMDLLRLGLERGDSALSAVLVIIEQLERYGQGGNCGFDHKFYYNNSFLVMDKAELYVLETCGKRWVYKKTDAANISNRLCIEKDGTAYSDNRRVNFAWRHIDPVFTYFSCSLERRRITAAHVQSMETGADAMAALRAHAPELAEPLCSPSVASVCMHGGGLVGDHTTSSMVVELGDTPLLWITGSSTPCISMFKPFAFGGAPAGPVFAAGDEAALAYWKARERFHRSAIGTTLPEDYYSERNALEAAWRQAAGGADKEALEELTLRAAAEEAAFYEKWQKQIPPQKITAAGVMYLDYWSKKNRAADLADQKPPYSH